MHTLLAVFKSGAVFGFEKLSQAKKLGSAPFICLSRLGADFLPRAQAVAAAGAANCRFEKSNTAELKNRHMRAPKTYPQVAGWLLHI